MGGWKLKVAEEKTKMVAKEFKAKEWRRKFTCGGVLNYAVSLHVSSKNNFIGLQVHLLRGKGKIKEAVITSTVIQYTKSVSIYKAVHSFV